MSRNPPTPLSPNEQTALDHLIKQNAAEETLSRETAIDHLIDAGFVAPAAEDLIEQLLLKGYLYERDEGIRVTNGD